jgi:hypothetical protein
MPSPMAARFNSWVCGRTLAGIGGVRIPPGTWMFVLCDCSTLSGGVSNESDREAPSGDAMTRNRVETPQKKKK